MNSIAKRDQGLIPVDSTDEKVVSMWLHGRPDTTQRAYLWEYNRFNRVMHIPLQQLTLADLQTYYDIRQVEVGTVALRRSLIAIKSLLSFANKMGYLIYNVGAAVQSPKVEDTLAERILSEGIVMRMLALEPNRRNYVILHLLYVAKLRASELRNLEWRNLQPHERGGQITIYGKGQKTRPLLLNEATWDALQSLRNGEGDDDPVFISRKGGPLSVVQLNRIVKKAAQRAGVENFDQVSAHWLRHSGASHNADKGCPLHILQRDLGHANVSTVSRYLHARPGDGSALEMVVPAYGAGA